MVNELMKVYTVALVILVNFALILGAVSAFVISPSSIDVPTLKEEDTFGISLVSDVKLSLLKANCTSVIVTFFENELFIETPVFATSSIESCVVSVFETGKPSVSFDFPIIVKIESPLYSNLTISYDATQLIIHNEGSGRGARFVVQDNVVSECILKPQESCVYAPKANVQVCEDPLCLKELFNHSFTDLATSESLEDNANQANTNEITDVLMWAGVFFAVFLMILLALYYFTRRNRALFKNTR